MRKRIRLNWSSGEFETYFSDESVYDEQIRLQREDKERIEALYVDESCDVKRSRMVDAVKKRIRETLVSRGFSDGECDNMFSVLESR